MERAAGVHGLSLPDMPILVLSHGRRVRPETAYGDEMERMRLIKPMLAQSVRLARR